MERNLPFLGHALNAVDAKGRVSVPAGFRNLIERRCRLHTGEGDKLNDKELMIALHDAGDRLTVLDAVAQYQLDADLRESVSELPAAERRAALASVSSGEFGNLSPASFDGAGRMVLPPMLRKFGAIGELALFWGTGDTFEIWNPERARKAFAANPKSLMTLDFLLEERGMAS